MSVSGRHAFQVALAPVLAALVLLPACTRPEAAYRRLTEAATCDSRSTDPRQSVTSLDSELYGRPVVVKVVCVDQVVHGVYYEAAATSDQEAAALFDRFSAELAPQFGPPRPDVRLIGRGNSFLCDPQIASVLLLEELQGKGAPAARVRLLVNPRPSAC
jgi:hypothetical protein